MTDAALTDDAKKRFKVIDGPISIRTEPDGERTALRLGQGEEFEALSGAVEKNGYYWVQHSRGWSAVGNTAGDEMLMLDISSRPADAPRTFRVWAQSISIRAEPNGSRLPQKLFRAKEFQVEPTSRTEAGGYIWWKHPEGWSAECSVNGKEIFMKEIFAAPAPSAVNPAHRTALPETYKGKRHMQLAQDTKVRGEPSTNPRGMLIITLKRGKLLEVDLDALVEADGYYWAKNELGWSAIQSVDGKTKFIAEPGSIPGMVTIGPYGPKAAELPGLGKLVTQLPVNLTDIQWFQYYGNNMWAYTAGKNYGYDRYSQGLHGGLDFGNSARAGVNVYAGIEGEYIKTDYSRKNNTKILIKNGDYTFIYQHITNARTFSPGQKITPDTMLAKIEHHSIDNGWDHLHFEVRYMDDWIINPLLLMTEAVLGQITARFNPEKGNETYKKTDSILNFFYKTAKWTRWTTPLDQPMLRITAPCIGPRFEDADEPYDIPQPPTPQVV